MKWRKLHKAVWMDPRLRAHEPDVRCALADLLMICADDGALDDHLEDLAVMAGMQLARYREVLTILKRLGMVEEDEDGLFVSSVRSDDDYARSRVAGGVAKHRAGKMQTGCSKDADVMLGEAPASVSGASGELLKGSSVEITKDVENVLETLRGLSGIAFCNASDLHEAAQAALMGRGFNVEREVRIDVSQNARDGRIDLVVRCTPPVAIELDRNSPRKGSIAKLARFKHLFGAVTVAVIRAKTWAKTVPVDFLIALADPNEVDKRREDVPIPKVLDTPEFKAALDEWFEYRRERNLPVWRPTTIRKNYREWERWGVAKAIEAMDIAQRSSWQGVFEPKADGSNGYRTPKAGSHAVPTATETAKMLAENRAAPKVAAPAGTLSLFEEAKRKALASRA